ncbi:hypothetical protein KNN17_13500 [Arthrobacter bambusae]|uniref:hypothetical protein n=1 Tax=Arthrobacter bambusae TaxID=1338426 RepID=UPI001F50CCD6|nr:hypothetical protein [Arthrobacter bambusae]MCI0142592.1 hypothetical protein [Arthrobacter bambusae]
MLSELPQRYTHRYTGLFARRFLFVAADATRKLADGWDYPICVLNRVEVFEDLYELDLAENHVPVWPNERSTAGREPEPARRRLCPVAFQPVALSC